ELFLDGARRGDVREQVLGDAPASLLLVDDGLAQLDALPADVDVARPFDERADVAVALPAKRAVGVAVAARAARRPPTTAARPGVLVRHAFSFIGAGPGRQGVRAGTTSVRLVSVKLRRFKSCRSVRRPFIYRSIVSDACTGLDGSRRQVMPV